MAKKKFYAVKKGITPGIYQSWPDAEAQVKGFPGARFKGFPTKEEAVCWLENDCDTVKNSSRKKKDLPSFSPKVNTGEVVIYTDGGAINNPGPGGYGAVLIDENTQKELSGGFRLTTNNRMELMACIVALGYFKGDRRKITLYSDSSYVVNGITKGWAKKWSTNGWLKSDRKPVLNQDLWSELLQLCEQLTVIFKWVKGHAGNPLNERCDKLAVQSAKGKSLQVDIGYERI